jgi:hypothetical protein
LNYYIEFGCFALSLQHSKVDAAKVLELIEFLLTSSFFLGLKSMSVNSVAVFFSDKVAGRKLLLQKPWFSVIEGILLIF